MIRLRNVSNNKIEKKTYSESLGIDFGFNVDDSYESKKLPKKKYNKKLELAQKRKTELLAEDDAEKLEMMRLMTRDAMHGGRLEEFEITLDGFDENISKRDINTNKKVRYKKEELTFGLFVKLLGRKICEKLGITKLKEKFIEFKENFAKRNKSENAKKQNENIEKVFIQEENAEDIGYEPKKHKIEKDIIKNSQNEVEEQKNTYHIENFEKDINNVRYSAKENKKKVSFIKMISKKIKHFNEEHISKISESIYKNLSRPARRLRLKVAFAMCTTTVFLISGSFAWFYEEYLSKGTILNVGNIECSIKQYDINGDFLTALDNTATVVYENNISNITTNSRFIEITNTGTLDMKYDITFSLDSTVATAGILYYRVYEVTSGVNAYQDTESKTRLQQYAQANPLPSNLEMDLAIPVSNMSTISNRILTGTIALDEDFPQNNVRYYRLDYGMYSTVNTDIYSGSTISVHMQGFAYQTGMTSGGLTGGAVWQVENEAQLRAAIASGMAGDTIKLIDDVSIDGTLNVNKRISLDTNSYTLNVTGDLVYDFVDTGDIVISTENGGKINVASNLYMNTPKSKIHFIGTNSGYDIYVADTVTLNGLQNDEEDGILLENTAIIKNTVGNIPADLYIMSNTRLTIGPNVSVGNVIAVPGSTNIEILNNGSIVQIILSDMELLSTFTKAQIYIYNLDTILGVVGGSAIVLPEGATPYKGPGDGNTLIIRGANSTDITVSGATEFTQNDIEYVNSVENVVPITGEENAYIVYIRESSATLQGLLEDYFEKENSTNISGDIDAIKKLMIFTVNAQYLENEDFAYMKSDKMSNLAILDISNARVIDGNVVNKITDSAMLGKTTLTSLSLPKTITTIGENAFYNTSLGKIPLSGDFTFLSIPSTVTSIGSGAFNTARYVQFEGYVPPEIESDTFTFSQSGVRIFVNESAIEDYQSATNYDEKYIHQIGFLSDDKNYFVHTHNSNSLGVSMIVATGNVGDALSVPSTIMYAGNSYPIVCIGTNAYSHITTPSTGTDLTIPTTVTAIGSFAFYNKEIISVNLENIKTIGDYAFYNSNLARLEMNNVTTIGKYAFYNNSELIYASMDSLTEIGDYALANTDLYEVRFGKVNEIGVGVLKNVEYLQAIYFETTETIMHYSSEVIKINALDGNLFNPNWITNTNDRIRIYVPNGKSNMGTTYVSLYSNIFAGYENYIYITGTQTGSYKHMAIDYDYHEYSIIQNQYQNVSGDTIEGIKIIEYHGADVESDYQIPSYFTINSVTYPVIEIGERAYIHVQTNGSNINIDNSSIYKIGDYAFYGVNMSKFNGTLVEVIGNYAFSTSEFNELKFKNLSSIGNNALENMQSLYSIDIGNAYKIGAKCISNIPNLEQIFWNRTQTSEIEISEDSFELIGTNAKSRLRIYVPSLKLSFYKELLTEYAEYIYSKGEIIGSFINVPIQYDIGEYAIRTVTIQDRNGVDVTGYEIIEYHGADFLADYNLPTELTVNGVTMDVISIGQRAFVHSKSESGIAVDIVSDTLLEIGDYAFNGVKGINSLSSESVMEIGSYAFNKSSLGYAIIPNVMTVRGYAFANMESLYKINLGYVEELETNALYNLDNLYQVFFEPVDNVLFSPYAITNVGAQTNNRIRFYVGSKEAQELVQILTPYTLTVTNTDTFTSNTTTSQSGGWFNMTYTNERTDTHTTTIVLKNNNTVEVENWNFDFSISVTPIVATNSTATHTLELTSVTGGTYEWDGATLSFTSDSSNSVLSPNDSITFTVKWKTVITQITNAGFLGSNPGVPDPTVELFATTPTSSHIENQTMIVRTRCDGIYKTYFRTEYLEYFYPKGTIGGSYTPTSISYDIGSYSTFDARFVDMDGYTIIGQELIEYHGADIVSTFQIPETIEVEGVSQDVVKIGDYAFKFASMAEGAYFNVVSDNLIQIGEHAFENLAGVEMVYCSSLQYVGNYAFYGNKIKQVTLADVRTIGEYAFASNTEMYYIDIGKANNIKSNAFRGNTNVAQIFFKSTSANAVSATMDIAIGENAFLGVGTTLANRLRVYVPVGAVGVGVTYASCYRNTLPTNLANYVYVTGTLIGSYEHGTIDYDIGEYSARMVTLTDVDGNSVTGAEIIEYHAENITADYVFPTEVELGGVTYDVISYGEYSYANISIEEDIALNLPTEILSIGDHAFESQSISTITGYDLIKIGKYAFANCMSLIKVELDGVKRVEDYAFYMCPELAEIYLGLYVEYIGSYALYNDDSTATINLYLEVTTPPTTGTSPFPARQSAVQGRYTYYTYSFWIYVPGASLSTYRNTSPYSDYTGVISGRQLGEQHVVSFASSGGYLYDIINTNEIEILAYRAETGGSITIPETIEIDGTSYTVTSLKATAFDATTNVTGITIPRYVNNIETGFLNNNTSINTISVDRNNQYFSSQNGVLYDKNKTVLLKYPPTKTTTQFSVPSTVVVIGKDAFSYNENLNTLALGSSVLVIDKDAFRYCTSISTLSFSNTTVPYITGFGVFDTCTALTTISVPQDSLSTYQSNLFLRKYTIEAEY